MMYLGLTVVPTMDLLEPSDVDAGNIFDICWNWRLEMMHPMVVFARTGAATGGTVIVFVQ